MIEFNDLHSLNAYSPIVSMEVGSVNSLSSSQKENESHPMDLTFLIPSIFSSFLQPQNAKSSIAVTFSEIVTLSSNSNSSKAPSAIIVTGVLFITSGITTFSFISSVCPTSST